MSGNPFCGLNDDYIDGVVSDATLATEQVSALAPDTGMQVWRGGSFYVSNRLDATGSVQYDLYEDPEMNWLLPSSMRPEPRLLRPNMGNPKNAAELLVFLTLIRKDVAPDDYSCADAAYDLLFKRGMRQALADVASQGLQALPRSTPRFSHPAPSRQKPRAKQPAEASGMFSFGGSKTTGAALAAKKLEEREDNAVSSSSSSVRKRGLAKLGEGKAASAGRRRGLSRLNSEPRSEPSEDNANEPQGPRLL